MKKLKQFTTLIAMVAVVFGFTFANAQIVSKALSKKTGTDLPGTYEIEGFFMATPTITSTGPFLSITWDPMMIDMTASMLSPGGSHEMAYLVAWAATEAALDGFDMTTMSMGTAPDMFAGTYDWKQGDVNYQTMFPAAENMFTGAANCNASACSFTTMADGTTTSGFVRVWVYFFDPKGEDYSVGFPLPPLPGVDAETPELTDPMNDLEVKAGTLAETNFTVEWDAYDFPASSWTPAYFIAWTTDETVFDDYDPSDVTYNLFSGVLHTGNSKVNGELLFEASLPTEYQLSGLMEGTTYCVKIWAYMVDGMMADMFGVDNNGGLSTAVFADPSDVLTVKTLGNAGGSGMTLAMNTPTIASSSITSNSFTVEWDAYTDFPASIPSGKAAGYFIAWTADENAFDIYDPKTWSMFGSGGAVSGMFLADDATSWTLHLDPETTYYVKMWAVVAESNHAMFGVADLANAVLSPESGIVSGKTLEAQAPNIADRSVWGVTFTIDEYGINASWYDFYFEPYLTGELAGAYLIAWSDDADAINAFDPTEGGLAPTDPDYGSDGRKGNVFYTNVPVSWLTTESFLKFDDTYTPTGEPWNVHVWAYTFDNTDNPFPAPYEGTYSQVSIGEKIDVNITRDMIEGVKAILDEEAGTITVSWEQLNIAAHFTEFTHDGAYLVAWTNSEMTGFLYDPNGEYTDGIPVGDINLAGVCTAPIKVSGVDIFDDPFEVFYQNIHMGDIGNPNTTLTIEGITDFSADWRVFVYAYVFDNDGGVDYAIATNCPPVEAPFSNPGVAMAGLPLPCEWDEYSPLELTFTLPFSGKDADPPLRICAGGTIEYFFTQEVMVLCGDACGVTMIALDDQDEEIPGTEIQVTIENNLWDLTNVTLTYHTKLTPQTNYKISWDANTLYLACDDVLSDGSEAFSHLFRSGEADECISTIMVDPMTELRINEASIGSSTFTVEWDAYDFEANGMTGATQRWGYLVAWSTDEQELAEWNQLDYNYDFGASNNWRTSTDGVFASSLAVLNYLGTSHTIAGLTANTTYHVKVWAFIYTVTGLSHPQHRIPMGGTLTTVTFASEASTISQATESLSSGGFGDKQVEDLAQTSMTPASVTVGWTDSREAWGKEFDREGSEYQYIIAWSKNEAAFEGFDPTSEDAYFSPDPKVGGIGPNFGQNIPPNCDGTVCDDMTFVIEELEKDTEYIVYVWGRIRTLITGGTTSVDHATAPAILRVKPGIDENLSAANYFTEFKVNGIATQISNHSTDLTGTVTGELTAAMDLTSTEVTFAVSEKATVWYNGFEVTSPQTNRNFTTAQTYAVTAENGVNRTYTVTITKSTSIGKFEVNVVSIYPNPATDKLYVEAAGMTQIEIIDMLGRTALRRTTSNTRESFEISSLKEGLYFVRIALANNEVVITRFVKK
jgi:hypothetical protein